jgi:hypothetical protein
MLPVDIPPEVLNPPAEVRFVDAQERAVSILSSYGITGLGLAPTSKLGIQLTVPKEGYRISALGEYESDGKTIDLVVGGGIGPTIALENLFSALDIALLFGAHSPVSGLSQFLAGGRAGLFMSAEFPFGFASAEASVGYGLGAFDFDTGFGGFMNPTFGERLSYRLDGDAQIGLVSFQLRGRSQSIAVPTGFGQLSGSIEFGGLVNVYKGLLIGGRIIKEYNGPARIYGTVGYRNGGLQVELSFDPELEIFLLQVQVDFNP